VRVDYLYRASDPPQRQAPAQRGGDVPALHRGRYAQGESRFRKVPGYRGLATLAVKNEQDLIRKRQLDSYTSAEEDSRV
jgi:hypothetical protein